MLGSRADIVVDLAYVVTLAAPLVALASLLLVRRGQQEKHRRVQIVLLTVCLLAVGALETRIRLVGGSSVLLQGSPYAGSALMGVVAAVHIAGAVLTYVVWSWLVITSRRRHRSALPGPFSRKHRIVGTIVIGGLCFTAVSATVVYTLAFVS